MPGAAGMCVTSPLPRWEKGQGEGDRGGNATLPILRQQKGDAASEARRRGFIHHQPSHPRYPITAHHENQRNQRFRQLTLDSHNICSNITTMCRSADHRNSARKTKNRRVVKGQRNLSKDAAKDN